MTCEEARRLLSARIDGEPIGAAGPRLDAHLTGCAACRAWLDAAHAVTRLIRLEPAPDAGRTERLTAALIAARRVPHDHPSRRD